MVDLQVFYFLSLSVFLENNCEMSFKKIRKEKRQHVKATFCNEEQHSSDISMKITKMQTMERAKSNRQQRTVEKCHYQLLPYL